MCRSAYYLDIIVSVTGIISMLLSMLRRFQQASLSETIAEFHNVSTRAVATNDERYTMKFRKMTLHTEKFHSYEDSRIVSRNTLEKLTWYIENYKYLPGVNVIPSPTYSKMFLSTNKKEFKVGELIRVKIHLFNNMNEPLRSGGDILRIWMTDRYSNSNSSGYIIDNGDGTYTGVVRALFPGKPVIKASIALSKYHIGIAYDYMEREGIWYYMTAKFEGRNGSSVTTHCSTASKFSFGNRTCDFTKINHGMSWYCGKPEKYGLTCDDWTTYSAGKFNYLLKNSSYDDFYRNKKNQYLITSIKILITGERATSPTMPCYRRPKEDSWEDHVPTGYFHKDTFYSLQCNSSHLMRSRQSYLKCLRGRPAHFFGDSTSRYWFVYLTEFLKLTFKQGRWDEIKDKAWQKYAYAEDKESNISITWAPHELPMYGSEASIRNIRSVASRLDDISADSKGIVVLHWYLHTARIPPWAYREHVINAKIAVLNLLRRAPNVSLFIKGPHAIMYKGNTSPHDFARRFNEQILYEEFASIRDKITYLEQWDMTVSSENINVHPPKAMNAVMVHHLLSHVCSK
ncbi:hypothetical protein FSP39_001998 [Pinctada imbricata]|uniref:NXPE C-terminal domain-containing protein n=1 Tax=Pinctada imbricata TaxID=66713 RepID=A0AA89BYH2_PINIB|nr:hypothetical protein FSP39_001998 [Pinctada imbricata]